MPYAMSVIFSRAIPGDRRLQALRTANCCIRCTRWGCSPRPGPSRANIVGQTMRLNPHGDASRFMRLLVRLSRGYEALLYPYVDSKGNFGKAYSRDMAYAASRYTEAKLEAI